MSKLHAATHPLARPELVWQAVPDDDRLWVPQAERVFFRPLMFDTVGGGWCNLLRVTRSGVLSRHRHPGPVHGFVIRSEEHTSELQSLMRISYAVFCLKKKN